MIGPDHDISLDPFQWFFVFPSFACKKMEKKSKQPNTKFLPGFNGRNKYIGETQNLWNDLHFKFS